MNTDVQAQNQRYYDLESTVYDDSRYSTVGGRRVERFHKRILSELLFSNLPAGTSVLELGCGTGRLLQHLLPYGFELYGVDISAGMLAIARQRLADNQGAVTLKQCDAASMPFVNATFDVVYSILVINLIPGYEDVFREVARILKPGGRFVFNVPNLASIYFAGGLYVNTRGRALGSNEAGHRYSHWFLPSEWRNALKNSAFEVERAAGQPPHLRIVDNAAPLNASGLGLLLSKSVYIRARRCA